MSTVIIGNEARTLPAGRGRLVAFAILSLVLGLGALVPAVVNIAIEGRFTWCLYAAGAVAMAWLVLAPWFLLGRLRVAFSWLAAAVTVPAFLALVQSMTPGAAWLLPLGLPAAAVGLAGLGVLGWLWAYSRARSSISLALTILVIGLTSFGEQAVIRPFAAPGSYELARALLLLCVLSVSFVLGMLALIFWRKRPVRDIAR